MQKETPKSNPDNPKYKELGISFSRPVFPKIGSRIPGKKRDHEGSTTQRGARCHGGQPAEKKSGPAGLTWVVFISKTDPPKKKSALRGNF